ncbi:MAG: L,D-transpeptidase family protein [Chitinophagales bacterium]
MYAQDSFLSYQLSFERVKNAFEEKDYNLKQEFQKKGFSYPPSNILLVSYKAEGELQVWIKEYNGSYRIFKVYDVCKKSGDFGPKRIQGDKQVPEGFYNINVFNPSSDFHLSLGISYPNNSDRLNSTASDLGGDIYIHGSCVTVGCLPMTDDIMEEIYLISAHAKNQGQQNIPIHLYPFKFNKLTEYIFYKEYPEHITFWENLKSEYYYFTNNKRIRNINIDSFGNYKFY